MRLPRRRGERGAALLAVVLMSTVAGALSLSILERASTAVLEVRARRDVLCARYAALGGLALGAPTSDPSAAAALVGPDVQSLAVAKVKPRTTWCVLRAVAACGDAVRTLDRTLADPSACDSAT